MVAKEDVTWFLSNFWVAGDSSRTLSMSEMAICFQVSWGEWNLNLLAVK
jgi:hypothetical protein